jgi:hypothetical protein
MHYLILAVTLIAPQVPVEAPGIVERPPAPMYVGWSDTWVACRYSFQRQKWETWKSPRAGIPNRKACTAVGDDSAAVLDPNLKYSGWLFDLSTKAWKAVPESPIGGRRISGDPIMLAFAKRRLVVWGTTGPAQGAVLDIDTMQWTPLPNAPIQPRFRAPCVVVGEKFIVWGGYFNELQDGAIFDLSRFAWELLPAAPIPFCYGTNWVVWRNRFVVFGGMPRGGGPNRSGAIYDPAAGKWELMAAAPFDAGCMAACAVQGDKLLLWSGREGTRDVAATYDFVHKAWQQIPNAPIVGRCLGFAHGFNGRFIVWGGWESLNGGPGLPQARFFRDCASFDPATNLWQKLPDAPVDVPYQLHPGW